MPLIPQPSPMTGRGTRLLGIIAIVGGIAVAMLKDRLTGLMIACFGTALLAWSTMMLPTQQTARWDKLILAIGLIAGIIGWILAIIIVF